LVAGSTFALVNPALVPVAIAGSTAPDWLEFLIKLAGGQVAHRGKTHIALLWVIGFIAGFFPIFNWHWVIASFCYGGLTHVFCDAMTASGVPVTWWSANRHHLFGGRFKTGMPGEYFVGVGTALFCGAVISIGGIGGDGSSPFFRDWPSQYEDGHIDLYEWREHRFEIF